VTTHDQRAIDTAWASFKSQVVSAHFVESEALDSVSIASHSARGTVQIFAGRECSGGRTSVVAVMLLSEVV